MAAAGLLRDCEIFANFRSCKHQTPFIAVYIFLSSRKNKDIKTEAKEHEFEHNNNKVSYVIYTDGDMQYACMPFIA